MPTRFLADRKSGPQPPPGQRRRSAGTGRSWMTGKSARPTRALLVAGHRATVARPAAERGLNGRPSVEAVSPAGDAVQDPEGHFSRRYLRVRLDGSGGDRVAGRRHRRPALVLGFDVDPGSVGSRVPDFLEGTGHRATNAPSATAVRQPCQPRQDRREGHQDGDRRQKVGHLSRVSSRRAGQRRDDGEQPNATAKRPDHNTCTTPAARTLPLGSISDKQPMVALSASMGYRDVQPNVAEGGKTMEIRWVNSLPVTQLVAAP
jgi:hypothetical protein